MNKSLDEDGNVVYKLGVLSNMEELYIPLTLTFTSNKDTITNKVSLFEYIPHYKENEKSYKSYIKDNIKVLEVHSLCRMHPNDESIEHFLEESKTLRGIDKLIIDLRGNTGGSMINVEKWYKGFTGQKLKKDIVQAGLYTNTSIELSKNKFKTKKNEPEDIKDLCLDKIYSYENENFYPGWSPIEYKDFKPVKNDTQIIILSDKNTSSAAEFFIHYLRKLENVNVVGTVSNGCVLTGNCNTAYLPNSHIKLHISHKIYMSKELNNIDGLGLMPDYWVKSDQALERAIKYLNNKVP